MTSWTTGTIKANDITLHYHRTGGDKPPLVLCHGITDAGLAWTRIAQAWQDHFDMIMVDARGHGRSDKPEHGYSAAGHAADVAGLIEGLGLGQPALIGHSMGASSVAVLAGHYPHLVKRIVLEDPPWRDSEQPAADRRTHFQELIARYQTMTRAEIVAYGRENNPTWDDEALWIWSEGKTLVSPNVTGFISEPAAPWQTVAAKISCPTLLVTGDPAAGAIVSPETAAALAAAQPNIQIAHISGAGHNIRRDQLAAYLEVVSTFLQQD